MLTLGCKCVCTIILCNLIFPCFPCRLRTISRSVLSVRGADYDVGSDGPDHTLFLGVHVLATEGVPPEQGQHVRSGGCTGTRELGAHAHDPPHRRIQVRALTL